MKYELLYLLRNKSLLCLFLILLIFCGVFSYYLPQTTQSDESEYNDTIDSLLSLSEKRLNEAALNDENSFAHKYYEKLIKAYTTLQSAEISVSEGEISGWGEFISCGYVFIAMLICCVAFCVTMFGREKQHGIFPVLYASKRGRETFVAEKLASSLLVCIVLAILFSLSGLVGASLRYGLTGGGQYIQSLTAFIYCPLALKVWQVAVISTLISALVAFAVSLFAGVIVYITESKLFSYALVSLFAAASFFFDRAEYLNSNAFFKNCNLLAAASPDVYLGRYTCLNIFSVPFFVLLADIILSVSAVVIFSFAFNLLHSKRVILKIKLPSVKINKTKKKQISKKPRAESLYGFELLKVYSSRLTVVLLAALTLFRVGDCIYKLYNGVPYSELIYSEYCRTWEGEITDQKSMEIRAENTRISDGYDAYSEYMQTVMMHAEYDGDVETVMAEYQYAQSHDEAFKRFQSRYEYAQANDGKILYESGWLSLFNNGVDSVLCIAVLYLCLFLTSYDRVNKTLATVSVTKNGYKRIYAARFLSLLTVCLSLTLIFEVCRAVPAVVNYGLPDGAYKLIYLSEYVSYPQKLSLSLYLLFIYAVKFFAVTSLCTLFTCAERILEKRMKR